jgi:cullin-associated NEDD8-dissociated protein 1
VACGEPAGQFGIIAQGSCGYTNSDGSLPFPREAYAALADANEDYPGSCGRCYQVGQQCAKATHRAASTQTRVVLSTSSVQLLV